MEKITNEKVWDAIDERIDRIDAFYKKRMDDLSSRINKLEAQERIFFSEIQELFKLTEGVK